MPLLSILRRRERDRINGMLDTGHCIVRFSLFNPLASNVLLQKWIFI